MKKHILSFFAACLLPLCAAAQATATIDGIKYYLLDGDATVMVQDETLSGDIVIPGTVSYEGDTYDVTAITSGAFKGLGITSIVLPDGITELPDECFRACGKLSSVTLPSNLRSMGEYCFSGNAIESISLPKTLTSLGEYCFGGCKLTSIHLPDGITSLPGDCFHGCSSLVEITMSDGVTSFGERCFTDCSFKSFDFPDALETIGVYAFWQCTSLESIELPKNLKVLEPRAFYGCRNLKEITFPNSLTSIGSECFHSCQSLKSAILPNALTFLGNDAFDMCYTLTDVTLPDGLTNLNNGTFRSCQSLKNITIPASVTYIGSSAFYQCTSLESINIPASVTNIGIGAFEYCTSLFSVIANWESLDEINVESSVFNNIFTEARLYVPNGTSNIYQTTEPWSSFKYIIEHDGGQTEAEVCATPTIAYEDGTLVFNSTTEGAEYHYTITDSDIKSDAYSTDGRIELTATYEISVYASAEGYKNSEMAKATLCFIDADLTTGIEGAAAERRAVVLTQGSGTVTISGLEAGEQVSLYSTSGTMLSTAKADTTGKAVLNTGGATGVALLKAGASTVKFAVK